MKTLSAMVVLVGVATAQADDKKCLVENAPS
jgi:hypothetical protein